MNVDFNIRITQILGNGYCVVCKNVCSNQIVRGKQLISVHPACQNMIRGQKNINRYCPFVCGCGTPYDEVEE